METLDEATRQAIDAATASMADLAGAIGVHQTTVARWHAGMTGVKPENAARLARAVRDRAIRMLEAAARLEILAGQTTEGET